MACSSADHPNTTTPVSAQAKTVRATKVPYSYVSFELSRKNDQAKSPVVAVCEKGDGTFTAVSDGILTPNKLLVPGLKQTGCSLTEASNSSSVPKMENQVGLNVQLPDTMPKSTSSESSQSANISAVESHQAATGDALMGLGTVSHQDLLIIGKQASQHTKKLTVSAFPTLMIISRNVLGCNQLLRPLFKRLCSLQLPLYFSMSSDRTSEQLYTTVKHGYGYQQSFLCNGCMFVGKAHLEHALSCTLYSVESCVLYKLYVGSFSNFEGI